MEDNKIVDLYLERSELAITETDRKYGRYCHYIAYNILYSDEDAKECVNDTYLKTWNSIPPHKPVKLSTFLGKITRNTAFDKYDYNTAEKRLGNMTLALEEMNDCIPKSDSDEFTDELVLKDIINRFLESLQPEKRVIFVRRYWYVSSIKEIAKDYALSESKVKVNLLRTRNKFKEFLEKEGVTL